MKKILLISPHALEYGRGGEISTLELANGLKQYYRIFLIDSNIFPDGAKLINLDPILEQFKEIKYLGKIRHATLNFSGRVFSIPYPSNVKKLFKIIKKSDVVYCSFFNFKTNLILLLAKTINRNLRIIIGHRRPLMSKKIFSLYNIKYRLNLLFLSLFYKRIYHHTLSKHAKLFLQKFYKKEQVFHIIHGINLEHFIAPKIVEEKKDRLNYLYIGYYDDVHKGMAALLKALEILLKKNRNLKIHFEFCGTGPLESYLNRLVNQFPEFIKNNSYIPNKDIHNYYLKNDVLLFTSRREPFGRILVEALGAGLIIISSKTIGSIELLRGKEFAFFLNELTPNEIANRIKEVYDLWNSNFQQFQKLQQKARDYVVNNFSFEIELQMFKELIDKITLNK
ncbi:MAG: glycosyltransferase family 4 protein [Promethearchaeota archaeon]